MNYTEYQYLYPPRPEQKIPQQLVNFYELRGYWAQIKKNGTNTVIFARGKDVIFKTRHAEDHRMWSPLQEHVKFFQSRSKNWNVFCAELLHSKTAHIKNQLYVYDQIVKDGVHLVGTSFGERCELLADLWTGDDEPHQVRVGEHVSVARNFKKGLMKLWGDLGKEDEGLVLKDPKGKLRACFKADANQGWQVKSRITHKNYGF